DWLQKGKLVAQGSLLPIGAGHKGYALIFVVGLLTSLLTDGDFPWNLGPQAPRPQTTGTVFLSLDLAAFGEPAAMRARADEFIDRLRASPRKEGVDGILYPGERSQALKQKGLARGRLELPQAQWQELTAMWEAKQAK
ncbi:Ldh family oxidoreductase, partial [Gammaproteobacteria bacterium PRO2]|nr:Ldh family oxidoreductase [Gammaproteobacteria bacterium PRO2]